MVIKNKKKMKYIVFFAPFLIFVFFLVILGAALGGGLSEEMETNGGKIESVVSQGNTVLASSLTSENNIGHTFVGAVKIKHVGGFKALSLILAVKVKQDTKFTLFLVQKKENENEDYEFRTLTSSKVERSAELTIFTLTVDCEIDNTNFLAVGATNDSAATDAAWEIFTISFISGGE